MSSLNISTMSKIISFDLLSDQRIIEISKEFQSLDVYITNLEILYVMTYCAGYYTTIAQYFDDV